MTSGLLVVAKNDLTHNNLANQFYGDSTLYWVLQIANEDCKRDSLYPPIGIQLRIPQNITKILQDFEEING